MSETTKAVPRDPPKAQEEPKKKSLDDKTSLVFAEICKVLALTLIYVLAFSNRLYSVLRYESVIHEFDPYFNFRTTKTLVSEGLYEFLNWFDSYSWYPLGRIVGGTVYPGLMLTAGFVHYVLNSVNITVNIRNVCVLLAPWFSSNTAMATYFLGKEVRGVGAGLLAAAFISIVPAYVSRSVAGSYDNEGVAIFALVFTFYLWIKSVKTGSILWSGLTCLAYFYMVAAWGGYVFITNLLPLHTLALLVSGYYTPKVYVAYSIFYSIGTLLAMQVTFVGFQAVTSSEHFASLGVFCLLQLHGFLFYVRKRLSQKNFYSFLLFLGIVIAVVFAVFAATSSGQRFISPWTGRFYSMFDPTYAKIHIPIIASVSEHQPTIWASYFFDLHILVWLFPAGLFYCFYEPSVASIFVICYGVTAVYFASVMVRLMLTLAPIACVLGGIAISATLEKHCDIRTPSEEAPPAKSEKKEEKKKRKERNVQSSPAKGKAKEFSFVIVAITGALLFLWTFHCTWVTSQAYSSPSIVLAAGQGPNRVLLDDFREAYRWLNHNTAEDARIMSWWDYGYQITAMANRTVLVDNNTWNNTHIATVGRAMCSSETEAYKIMLQLDVDYVLVIFGGVIGYSGDDINKFLWMVRIAGGVWPEIRESDYFNARGEYKIDSTVSPTMRRSLMYKLCYYRFGEIGHDRVRNTQIGDKNVKLTHLEEVYTSEHWIVRIYKVLKPRNRAHDPITLRKKKKSNKTKKAKK